MPIELEALIKSEKLPCSEKAAQIIRYELERGNKINSFGDIGTLPDDTYYFIFFEDFPKGDYPNIKTLHRKDNVEYMVIYFFDNHGGLEIRFHF